MKNKAEKAAALMTKHGIKLSDTDAARQYIDVANGKATSWTIDLGRAVEIAKKAEAELKSRGIKAKDRLGAELEYLGPGASSKKYKYGVQATSMRCRRYRDGWRIMFATTEKQWPGKPSSLRVRSREQVEAAAASLAWIKAQAEMAAA
ncbi:hypothetical protein FY136_28545 (plasmid) [Agrobacterium tumefaciens]|uniref:hypothetical protein n=1 Tax=Agrobacterium tumefaciens TaxID=358 RepID=UPI0021D0333A|nr:hypothetical protein [Agrobacterium tumefaciens]UXT53213.1 hypothetical protein FY136_28545 [Agrobacterium tumefaciens]